MIPFYNTDARRAAVVAEARSWLDTPFSENCAVKGPQGGVSCVRFLGACHTAAGACRELQIPLQPVEVVRQWHEHHSESLILAWFDLPEVRGRVRRVDEDEQPMIGDMAVVRVGKTEHHVGLWCGHELIHVAIPAGVVAHSTRDPQLRAAIRCVYRVSE